MVFDNLIHKEMSIHAFRIYDYDEVYEFWRNTPKLNISKIREKESIQKFLSRNREISIVCRVGYNILCGHDAIRGYIYHGAVAEEYRYKDVYKRLV